MPLYSGLTVYFKPNTLVVPPSAWAALNEPFSNYINLTVLDWIKKSIDIENFVMFLRSPIRTTGMLPDRTISL